MKDMRGVILKVGQVVAYGKSDRWYPINTGTITELDEEQNIVKVLGKGNTKTGWIGWTTQRILVLPADYLEEIL